MVIAWFSAGITSAVACKLALEKYDDVELFYIHIESAHKDNSRFIADCEKWYGKKINVIRNSKGYEDQFDVIRKTKYINGPTGARCTLELKKNARYEIEATHEASNQVFGFEYSKPEINRAIRFKEQYPNTNPLFPLIDAKLSKDECAGILHTARIELPYMYKLGYNNNNCIGCVKGGKGYWNKIRQDFPAIYQEMAQVEREIGATCLKEQDENGETQRVYLDEPCGMFCQVEFAHIMDKRVEKIVSGEMDICQV